MKMIEVDKLRVSYGAFRAVDGVSFSVDAGEVVGFLGPNGAGKSTTLRVLAGFLGATSGSVRIAGIDVAEDSLGARAKLGYMPEMSPLYPEMRVGEYLRFRAELKKVPRGARKDAVQSAMREARVDDFEDVMIGHLSKGYKQRVGLAQAMVHEPDVLILDEPTSGLDPNQIVEVRRLIQQLAEEHTVILSTHYLQEVEAVATRVIIVNRGRIVADAPRDDLVRGASAHAIRVRVKGPQANILAQIGELMPGRQVDVIASDGDYHDLRVHVTTELRDATVPEALADLMVKNGWAIAELVREQATLEDVFRSLTASPVEGGGA